MLDFPFDDEGVPLEFGGVGGDVPEYLDPLDGAGWLAAIVDYATTPSPRRKAQLERLGSWRPCTWENHMRIVLGLIDSL